MSRKAALEGGDLPNAPIFRAFCIVLLGVGAALGAAWNAPFIALMEQALSGSNGLISLIITVSSRVIFATLTGAMTGLCLAQLLSAAWAFQFRSKLETHPESSPIWARMACAAFLPLAAVTTPFVVAHLSAADAGWTLIYLPIVTLGSALLICLPIALFERAVAVARWTDRIDPDPPPRRDPDARAPVIEATLRANRQQ